jgi:hypothetical protein
MAKQLLTGCVDVRHLGGVGLSVAGSLGCVCFGEKARTAHGDRVAAVVGGQVLQCLGGRRPGRGAVDLPDGQLGKELLERGLRCWVDKLLGHPRGNLSLLAG